MCQTRRTRDVKPPADDGPELKSQLIALTGRSTVSKDREAVPATPARHTRRGPGGTRADAYAIANAQVPNIFVGGENIGGSDDLQALHQQGKLKATLEKANAI